MENIKEHYEKSVFKLQELSQQIQSVRQKLERQIEVYRLERLKDKRSTSASLFDDSLETPDNLLTVRESIDTLSKTYRELIQQYETLQEQQHQMREQLIENNAQPKGAPSKKISHDVLVLRNFYEAIRVGEHADETIDSVLTLIRQKKKKTVSTVEEDVHFFETLEMLFMDLTRTFIHFDSELADLVDLKVDMVTDYQTTENFWIPFNQIKDRLDAKKTVSEMRQKLQPNVQQLRHTVHLILLDLETHKNILELDLIQ